jgi:four helix bundle protein
LSIARTSVFENANILLLLRRRGIVSEETLGDLLEHLDHLSHKLTRFRQSLRR